MRDRYGALDILIHTLGGSSTPAGGFAVATEDDWQRELALNLLPAVRLDRALLPPMLDAGRGAVVHVSSIQRRLPLFDSTLGYAAAKAALTTYSKGLSRELAPRGVRVNVVSPGAIRTSSADAMAARLAGHHGVDQARAWQMITEALGGSGPAQRRRSGSARGSNRRSPRRTMALSGTVAAVTSRARNGRPWRRSRRGPMPAITVVSAGSGRPNNVSSRIRSCSSRRISCASSTASRPARAW